MMFLALIPSHIHFSSTDFVQEYSKTLGYLALDYPAWEINWCGCALIRLEFASSAIANVKCTNFSPDFSLIQIAKRGGVDAGVRITEGPL